MNRSTAPALTQIFDEIAPLGVGSGIIAMAVFPLAVPTLARTAIIAIAAGLLVLVLCVRVALVAAPIVLLRRRGRRGYREVVDQLVAADENTGQTSLSKEKMQ